jgi:hypothetical protein
MRINKDNIFLFDFWFIIGLALIIFLILFIQFENYFFSILFFYTFFLFMGYNFIKSICGGILFIKFIIIRGKLFALVLLLNILFIKAILFFIFMSLTGDFILDFENDILTINFLSNMFGIPMWFIYSNSKNEINDILSIKRIIIYISTEIIIFIVNYWIFIQLLD